VTDRLEPVSKTGNVTPYDSFNQTQKSSLTPYADGNNTNVSLRIDKVSFVIQKSPGASDINVSATTFELVGPDGTDRFPFQNKTAINASEGEVSVLQDDDDSLETSSSGHILNSQTDRLVVTLDLNETANEPAFTNGPLEPGESATIRINTESGATSIIRIQVPQSLSGAQSVEL